jgi:hypothetical protein
MRDPASGGAKRERPRRQQHRNAARPTGWNFTGFAINDVSLGGKWLELLSEIAPGLKRIAILFNPDTSPASAYMPSLETAARPLKVAPIIVSVHSDVEIETAIIAPGREPGGGLVVMPDVFVNAHRAPIILAAETTYRRSISFLFLPEAAGCSPLPRRTGRPLSSCGLLALQIGEYVKIPSIPPHNAATISDLFFTHNFNLIRDTYSSVVCNEIPSLNAICLLFSPVVIK